MARKADSVVFDGRHYRVMPPDKDGSHARLTMKEIRALPRAAWNADSEQFEFDETGDDD